MIFILYAMPWFYFFLFKIILLQLSSLFFQRGRNSRDTQIFSSSGIVSDFAFTNSFGSKKLFSILK